MKRFVSRAGVLGVAWALLGAGLSPAYAGGDISNFKVKNCANERIFVCSFDKTDSLMKVPYKAGGVQPGDKKEFGCASIGRCKVIIGVSKRTTKRTLSTGMTAALGTGAVVAGSAAGVAGGVYLGTSSALASTAIAVTAVDSGLTAAAFAADAAVVSMIGVSAVSAAVVGVAVGGAIAGIEIADGWSDGEVCNQVRKAAQKAGLKPKDFLQGGKTYTVVAQYAVDKDGNLYLNPDGTAVLAYVAKKSNSCPAPLRTQLVPN
jgi:hypothetical protein